MRIFQNSNDKVIGLRMKCPQQQITQHTRYGFVVSLRYTQMPSALCKHAVIY